MTQIQCGFDKTSFEAPFDWIKIIEKCKINGYKELDDEKGFLWTGENIKVVTGDDPMSGLSRIKAMRHEVTPGWAGYIGITGKPEAVLEFVGLVFMTAKFVKGFDPKKSSFIGID